MLLSICSVSLSVYSILLFFLNSLTNSEIFESKSLTLSEAKFIPFRSLNKARKDSIIRVHKFSKKLESDFEIEILEDFLSEYEIEKIFDEENNIKYSFLGKVKNKFKNKIVLSRFEAYLL